MNVKQPPGLVAKMKFTQGGWQKNFIGGGKWTLVINYSLFVLIFITTFTWRFVSYCEIETPSSISIGIDPPSHSAVSFDTLCMSSIDAPNMMSTCLLQITTFSTRAGKPEDGAKWSAPSLHLANQSGLYATAMATQRDRLLYDWWINRSHSPRGLLIC